MICIIKFLFENTVHEVTKRVMWKKWKRKHDYTIFTPHINSDEKQIVVNLAIAAQESHKMDASISI
jgi:putative NIF3 family GTP cyclohydrolase 1 type 2